MPGEVTTPKRVSPFVGEIIRNVGTILRLDPDDEESEDIARQAAEQRAWLNIAAQLEAEMDALLESGPPAPEEVMQRLRSRQEELRRELEAALDENVSLGVNATFRGLERAGLSFNYRLVHSQAQLWARNYSYELIRGIDMTSARQTQEALVWWAETGEPLDSLVDQLRIVFGSERAEAIAVTEATRAYAEGTKLSYAAAGFNEGQPTVIIPQHPRCRCFYSLEVLADGTAYWIFNTVNDEHVCSICNPYHWQRVGMAKRGRGNG